jgi:2-methylcitrate dehydratase PrpD
VQPDGTPRITNRLAGILATTKPHDLPPQVFIDAQRAVLDWLGSVIAGATEPAARMARRVATGLGTSGDATIVGGGRASAAVAAFANGVAAHILELDDIHKGSTVHGAAPIVAAALAVAEREHATGRACLAAVALGYEAAFRIGEAVNPSHYRFWHPTGAVATFGAAAAAGSLLHLTADQMVQALGSAGTRTIARAAMPRTRWRHSSCATSWWRWSSRAPDATWRWPRCVRSMQSQTATTWRSCSRHWVRNPTSR